MRQFHSSYIDTDGFIRKRARISVSTSFLVSRSSTHLTSPHLDLSCECKLWKDSIVTAITQNGVYKGSRDFSRQVLHLTNLPLKRLSKEKEIQITVLHKVGDAPVYTEKNRINCEQAARKSGGSRKWKKHSLVLEHSLAQVRQNLPRERVVVLRRRSLSKLENNQEIKRK